MNIMELFYRHLAAARLNGNEIQCCMAHAVIGRSDLQRCVGSFLLYRRTRSWRNGEIILKDYRRSARRSSKKK